MTINMCLDFLCVNCEEKTPSGKSWAAIKSLTMKWPQWVATHLLLGKGTLSLYYSALSHYTSVLGPGLLKQRSLGPTRRGTDRISALVLASNVMWRCCSALLHHGHGETACSGDLKRSFCSFASLYHTSLKISFFFFTKIFWVYAMLTASCILFVWE